MRISGYRAILTLAVLLGIFLSSMSVFAEGLDEDRCEYPAWSVKTQDTGAERIAYALVSKVYGTQIWTINTDNARNKIMLTSVNWNRHPYWSYDGKRLAFAGGDEKQVQQIYVMNEDGTELVKITKNSEDKLYPVFSPNGEKMVYFSIDKDEGALYEANSNGTGEPKLLTKCGKLGKNTILSPAAYSYDGGSIAYIKLDPDFKNQDIYIFFKGTGKEERITTTGFVGSGLAWSPNGANIAFASPGKGKGYSIYIYNVSSKEITEVVTAVTPLGVSFSPDSKKICFLRNYQIWTSETDGKNQKQLTTQEVVTDIKDWQDRKKQNLEALMKLKDYIGKTVWLKKTIITDRGEYLEKLSEARIMNVRNKMLLPDKYRVMDDSRFGLEIELKIKNKKFYIVYLYESSQYMDDFSRFFFMTNPYTSFGWSKEIWDAIHSKAVFAGMSKTQVMLSLGEPTEIIKNQGSETELWNYKFVGTVSFVQDKVKDFKPSRKEINLKGGGK